MLKTLSALCAFLILLTFSAVPVLAEDETPQDAPDAMSEYILLTDTGNGQVIWAKNASDRMYPASMTKMMTEILAIEMLPDLDERIPITPQMLAGLYEANASVAGFLPGDEPTVRDLLYGIALASGADCVNAVAFRTAGSVPAFVELMNRKAAEIGMEQTHFTNPTGLHDDDHYSSCHDIETLFSYCFRDPLFRSLLSDETYRSTPVASAPEGLFMKSTVWSMITDDPIPGFLGGKTGYTEHAGRCLASAAEINGMSLVLVTGRGPADNGAVRDAGTIYSWAYSHLHRKTLLASGELLTEIPVEDSRIKSVSVFSEEGFAYDVNDSCSCRIEKDFPASLSAPVKEDDLLGEVRIYENERLIYARQYYAETPVPYSRLVHIRRILSEIFSGPKKIIPAGAFLLVLLLVLLIRR